MLLVGPVWAVTVEHFLHLGVGVAGLFWLCRRLGASRLAAVLGGTSFAFCHFLTTLSATPNIAGAACSAGFILL